MRIILFLLLILFVVIFFAISREKLSLKSKIYISILIFLCFSMLFLFNLFENTQNEKNKAILNNFIQNKPVKCGNYEINSTTFNYEAGTGTFIAKDNKFGNIKLSIDECIL